MWVEVATILNAGATSRLFFSVKSANLTTGADTTIASMLGVLAFIMQENICSRKLRDEIDAADAAGELSEPTVTYKEAAKLPYLDAFIREAMRLAAPVATIVSREVPASGVEILPGDIVPAGTKLGINGWVLMHSKEVYGDDVEEFKPERWLDSERRKTLQKLDLSFGSGART